MKPADVFGCCYKCGSNDIQHEDNGKVSTKAGGFSWRSAIRCKGCGREVIMNTPATYNAEQRFKNERAGWNNKE